MIIVKMVGGLANKMFQYALYKRFVEDGKDVYVDIESFVPKWDFERIELPQIFSQINFKIADINYIKRLAGEQDLVSKVRRKIKFLNKSTYLRESGFKYHPNLFSIHGDCYLEGCWQTEKYFIKIREKLLCDFKFKEFDDERNKQLANSLNQEESVAIHVRKGADYNKKDTKGTCKRTYYQDAVEYIKLNIINPKFYVFTDNKEWVKENIHNIEYNLIDWNPTSGPKNFVDMQLMSKCKHNIIANSSYSWWGAWLNNNPQKIVVGPRQWFNSKVTKYDASDIMPDNWIKL
jgi:hypothetical protein